MTRFPHYDTIEYQQTSNVATNDTLTGSDFDTVNGGKDLSSNEVFEVERIEILPPTDSSGNLQEFEWVRLQDGSNYYPHIHLRSFMMGWDGANMGIRTPKFGVPVLSNKVNAQNRPILTACPKFGPNDSVNISIKNNGTQITGDFTIRVYGWRFKGTQKQFQDYFSARSNLMNTYEQDVSLSNPFKDEGNVYTNNTVNIVKGADGGAHGQFTNLTGGLNQTFPKVYPWATWATNNNATQANTEYNFDYQHRDVDSKYKSMYFDYSDGDKAVIFNYAMVKEDVSNLKDFRINLQSRPTDEESQLTVKPNDLHELPEIRRDDGTTPSANQVVVQTGGPRTVSSPTLAGTSLPLEAVDRVPRRLGRLIDPTEAFVWNDQGGVQVEDNGTSIAAGNIRVGIIGYKMELKG